MELATVSKEIQPAVESHEQVERNGATLPKHSHPIPWYLELKIQLGSCSVQFSHSVVSNYLRPHGSQHARPPCPSLTPGVYSNSCPSSRWCHPAISSSVIPFSSCPQSFPASGSFPMSQLFAWGGQSIGVSASASVLPMNTLDTCISKLCHLAPQASLTYRSETPGSMRHFLWAKKLLLSPVLSGLGSTMVDSMEILWNLALTLEEGVRKPAGSPRWEGNKSDKWAFSLRKSPWVLKACGAE